MPEELTLPTVTVTFDGARLLTADGDVLTAAALLDVEPGEYRWESDPAILTMDTLLNASTGKVVFEAGGFGHRALPLTFDAQLQSADYHDGADLVGRIDAISAEGLSVFASGWITVGDGEDDPGRRYAIALATGNMRAVSVDAQIIEGTVAYELDNEGFPIDATMLAHVWEITGLTGVKAGADPVARVRLSDELVEEVEDEIVEDDETPDVPEEEPMAASATDVFSTEPIRSAPTPEAIAAVTADATRLERVSRWTPEDEARMQEALTAAADVKPPSSWFDNPNLTAGTSLQVTDDGRVFGHLATWENDGHQSCHVGFGECVCVPKSPDGAYPYFLTGEVSCSDGKRRPVGILSLYGGHHDKTGKQQWQQVQALYDDPSHCGALVNVGEDEHGIWAAGIMRPGASEHDRAMLRAAAASGDWRRIPGDPSGSKRLIAACAVVSPGFPIAPLVASIPEHLRDKIEMENRDMVPDVVEGPVVVSDQDGIRVLLASSSAGVMAAKRVPVDRETFDRVASEMVSLRAEVAELRALVDLGGVAGHAREAAKAALSG